MTAADWLALAAILLTGLGMAAPVVYQLGKVAARISELSRRVNKSEDRLARIEGKINRLRPLRTRSLVTVCHR